VYQVGINKGTSISVVSECKYLFRLVKEQFCNLSLNMLHVLSL